MKKYARYVGLISLKRLALTSEHMKKTADTTAVLSPKALRIGNIDRNISPTMTILLVYLITFKVWPNITQDDFNITAYSGGL